MKSLGPVADPELWVQHDDPHLHGYRHPECLQVPDRQAGRQQLEVEDSERAGVGPGPLHLPRSAGWAAERQRQSHGPSHP